MPLATIITPNVHEAEIRGGCEINTIDDAKKAAKEIRSYGAQAVLVKGGHLPGPQATDVLYCDGIFTLFEAERIETKNTHGTGCTYSAAIVTRLALGEGLVSAVRAAKDYVTNAFPLFARHRTRAWAYEPFLFFVATVSY